jgi:hypothetical protein
MRFYHNSHGQAPYHYYDLKKDITSKTRNADKIAIAQISWEEQN